MDDFVDHKMDVVRILDRTIVFKIYSHNLEALFSHQSIYVETKIKIQITWQLTKWPPVKTVLLITYSHIPLKNHPLLNACFV